MNKVYIVEPSFDYVNMFLKFGWEVVSDIKYAHIVQFTGGSDVSPSLYKEEKHSKSFCNESRDTKEIEIFDRCLEIAMPMAGICRGGQFLNVMSGGKMYQHVSNHCVNHDILDLYSDKIILASSTHHQMMIPSKEGNIIAVGDQGGIRERMLGSMVESIIVGKEVDDTEAVFYEHTNSLCFQPHPEFSSQEYLPLQKYYFECINRYLI